MATATSPTSPTSPTKPTSSTKPTRDDSARLARRPVATAASQHSDEELAARLRQAVTKLHRRLRQQSTGGLSPTQMSLLGSVDRLGSPTLGELAAAEQVQPPTVTRLVAAMEREGILVRNADPTDRRVSRVTLSAEGRRRLQRIRSRKTAFLTTAVAGLSDAERRQLAEVAPLLERLARQ